jgi:hypothetical protein
VCVSPIMGNELALKVASRPVLTAHYQPLRKYRFMYGAPWNSCEKGTGNMITNHLSLSLWPPWDRALALWKVE